MHFWILCSTQLNTLQQLLLLPWLKQASFLVSERCLHHTEECILLRFRNILARFKAHSYCHEPWWYHSVVHLRNLPKWVFCCRIFLNEKSQKAHFWEFQVFLRFPFVDIFGYVCFLILRQIQRVWSKYHQMGLKFYEK